MHTSEKVIDIWDTLHTDMERQAEIALRQVREASERLQIIARKYPHMLARVLLDDGDSFITAHGVCGDAALHLRHAQFLVARVGGDIIRLTD